MTAIKNAGRIFSNEADFLAYLRSVKFDAWRPKFVTMHNTGSPDLKTWRGWQTRAKPVSDEQWMRNLSEYYGNQLGWRSGPHFFFTPTHYCVLTPPDVRGVHAVSFNAVSWGVECVGDFDNEILSGDLRNHYVGGLAALHTALGIRPDGYVRGVSGLHFHRDDPKTTKTCPGTTINKAAIVSEILSKMGAAKPATVAQAPAAQKPAAAPAPKPVAAAPAPKSAAPAQQTTLVGAIRKLFGGAA